VVGSDLQDFRGTLQPVDLVQDNPTSPKAFEEGLRVIEHPPHARQLAVEILGLGKALTENGLSDSPHAGEPDHRSPLPCQF
jgi:hypothetical protein